MDNTWRPLMALGVGFGIVVFIIAIVAYVLFSLGLMKLAQNKGLANAWLAWIPFGNLYILGKIVETAKIGNWEVPRLDIILPLLPVAGWVLGLIPVLGTLVSLAIAVFMGFVLYKLFSMYRPEQAVLYTVLSIVLGLVWVFVFVIRDDKQVA